MIVFVPDHCVSFYFNIIKVCANFEPRQIFGKANFSS